MTKKNGFRKLAINMFALSLALPICTGVQAAISTTTSKNSSLQTSPTSTTVQTKTLTVSEQSGSKITPIKDKADHVLETAKTKLNEIQKTLIPATTTTTTTTEKTSTTTETKGAIVSQPEEKKETIVLMDTEKGPIKIKLFMEEAPITAGNFKDLVERGFYNGITFHRLIRGFVIQGGCPLGNGMGGFTDPATGKQRTIKHEKNNLRHDKAGMLAMARTNDPDSASSQFFIDLAPLPALNPGGVDPYGYVVFGQVIEGMDVVNKIMSENVPPSPGSDGTSNPVHIKTAKLI